MTYSYFPGCTLKNKAKDLDKYARICAEALGFTLEEIPQWQCCGGEYPLGTNEVASKLPSVRALASARDKGQDLVTLCSACYNVIKQTNDAMQNDETTSFKANNYLKEDSIEYLIKLGVDGLKRVLENNEFTRSDKVIDTLKEYEEENNPILGFISEETESNIVNQSVQDVYLRYSLFCSQNQLQALSKIAFSKQICNRLSLKSVTKRIDDKIVRILIKE